MRQAQARGLRAVVADKQDALADAPEIVSAADEVAELDYTDAQRCVRWTRKRARSHRLAGVYGFREYAMEAVAQSAGALGLPGNPPEAVAIVRDKYLCREALRSAGFRQPATAPCASFADARRFAEDHAGPWVLKPRTAMGSLGVAVVADSSALEQVYEALDPAQRARCLIETYQSGDELSAEGVFVAGRPCVAALTQKHLVGAGSLVEKGHLLPAPLPLDAAAAATNAVEAALTTLRLCFGTFHVELWLDRGQPVLGEIHVRPGGDYIHLMLELVTGVEPYGAVFDQLVGKQVDPASWRPGGAAAILYFTPPSGVVRAITGREVVEADPALVRLDLPLVPGARVRPLRESSDRPGFVLARADTSEQAWVAAQRLHDLVHIEIESEPVPEVEALAEGVKAAS